MKKICLTVLILALCMSNTSTRIGCAGDSPDFDRCRTVPESVVELVEPTEIRIGPGQNYPVVGSAESGERFAVVGMMNEWYIVQRGNGSIGVLEAEKTCITQIKEIRMAQGDGDDEIFEGNDEAAELFQAVNALRVENGLQPFEWDAGLNRIAEAKADDMTKNNYFGHYSETYGTPFAMLKNMNYEFKLASECITYKTEEPGMGIFSNTSGRANMLGRFEKMGIGVSEGGDNGIIVQLFVKEP